MIVDSFFLLQSDWLYDLIIKKPVGNTVTKYTMLKICWTKRQFARNARPRSDVCQYLRRVVSASRTETGRVGWQALPAGHVPLRAMICLSIALARWSYNNEFFVTGSISEPKIFEDFSRYFFALNWRKENAGVKLGVLYINSGVDILITES